LYFVAATADVSGVYLGALDGSISRRLLEADAAAMYDGVGHLIYVRQGTLFAQPFDLAKGSLRDVAVDRAYDSETIRCALRARQIVPWLAMRRTAHGRSLGRWRWGVERTFAWRNQFRRVRVRYDKRAEIHEALLSLGAR
jgi:hypothetical protein